MRAILAGIVWAVLSAGCGGHDAHRFDDPDKWAAHFESKERDAWQQPERVVDELSLAADDIVAEIGSGTGYFAVHLAKAVPRGRVWAVDIEPAMVDHLNQRARMGGYHNLFSILGTEDSPLLPEPVDLLLVANTYHHITDRTAYFRRLTESLGPNGRLVIIDFRQGELPVGPPESMKLSPKQVEKELASAGYRLKRTADFLPHQYILVFELY